jgi:hypothetical protein
MSELEDDFTSDELLKDVKHYKNNEATAAYFNSINFIRKQMALTDIPILCRSCGNKMFNKVRKINDYRHEAICIACGKKMMVNNKKNEWIIQEKVRCLPKKY